VQERAAAALALRSPLGLALTDTLTATLDATGAHTDRAVRIEKVLAAGGEAAVRTLFARLGDAEWARAVVADVGLRALPYLRDPLRRGGPDAQVAASYGLLELRKAHPAALVKDVSAIVEAMLPRLGEPNLAAEGVLAAVGKPAADRLVEIVRRPYLSVGGAERHAWQYAGATLAEMWSRNPASVASVVAALARRDYATIAMLDVFFVQLGKPGSEDVLIAALNAKGETGMALDFIMSGNPKLAAAARAWAASHGYVYSGSGTTGMWGSARRASP